jgi:hypothetical protein
MPSMREIRKPLWPTRQSSDAPDRLTTCGRTHQRSRNDCEQNTAATTATPVPGSLATRGSRKRFPDLGIRRTFPVGGPMAQGHVGPRSRPHLKSIRG